MNLTLCASYRIKCTDGSNLLDVIALGFLLQSWEPNFLFPERK